MIRINLDSNKGSNVAVNGSGIDLMIEASKIALEVASKPGAVSILRMILEVIDCAEQELEHEETIKRVMTHLSSLNDAIN